MASLGVIRAGKARVCARAQFTPSVRHDGRDRVNHRRELRRECFTHNLAREHEFTILPSLAKITEDVVYRRKGTRRRRGGGGGGGRSKR